ncbi:MAG: NAD-binding protein [Verrucomicrobiota bacterium]
MAWFATRSSIAQLKREITITGGGLAGLSLAIALRTREVPVTVIEAGNYPRHRVCGEFISGVSRETLKSLGIAELFEDARLQRSIAWFDSGRIILRGSLKQPALGISRYRLDQRLVDHFLTLGGILRSGVRCQPDSAEGSVWTAGRRPENGPWIGLKLHIRGIMSDVDLEMHSGSNGYAGLAGVEDGWINVCGLFRIDRELRAHPASLLYAYLAAGGLHALAERIAEAETRPGSVCAVAGFQLGRQRRLPDVMTLGDAQSMIPPFTGNGMSMAFQAAELALAPLVAWSGGRTSWQQACNGLHHSLMRHFRRRLAMAQTVHPLLFQNSTRNCLRSLSAGGVLPFHSLLALVR